MKPHLSWRDAWLALAIVFVWGTNFVVIRLDWTRDRPQRTSGFINQAYLCVLKATKRMCWPAATFIWCGVPAGTKK